MNGQSLPSQIHGARAMLGLSQADLGKLSGVSLPRIVAVEHGKECLQSTHAAIVGVLEARGAVFGQDGSVKIVPQAERFIVPPGQNPSAETRALTLVIVNARRERDGLPPLVDIADEEDQ